MRRGLSVLAATLVVAAGTGCMGDDDEDSAAPVGTTGAAQSSTTTAESPDGESTTGDDSTTEGSPSTRPEPPADQSRWAKQADAACKPVQERIDTLRQPTTVTGLSRWLTDLLPLLDQQVRALERLKPPTDEEEARRVTLFVAALRDLERSLTRYRNALRADDGEAAKKALAEANAAGAAARSYAISLDITQCGGYDQG